jgi:hypothetical protein
VLLATLAAWPAAWWGLGAWLSHFPDRAPLGPDLFLAATAASLLVAGLAAGAYAWKAANQQPALAIRYE